MSTKKISELETTSAVSTSDLMETAIPSGSSYASKKMSIAQLATYLENSVVHSALDTTNKTIIDAINELKSICDNLSASHFIVANQLPTSDINMNAIYLIPKQSTGVNDVYEEYICLDDTTTPATWEKIGETQIDLSNYITFDDADIATTSKNGSMSKADRSKMNGIESGAQKNVQSDWDALSGDAFIKNKPTIPDELADLSDDSTHRLVTDTEKSTWNNDVKWSENNILGAKNLITFPYYSGFNRTLNNVTFAVNNEGVITVGGTQASANTSFYLMYDVVLPNGTYTLSDGGVGTADTYLSLVYYTGGSSTANYIDVGTSGSVTFTAENWDRIRLRIWSRNGKTAANLVFKPMLRLSTISDSTFEPYAETNRQLTLNKMSWEENKASGVKNYFTYPFYPHPLGNEVYPVYGVEWTNNGDGSITANGTSQGGTSYCQLMSTSTFYQFTKLPPGRYHFSGGISSDYYMNISTVAESNPSGNRTIIDYDYGDGFDFEVTEEQSKNKIFCSFAFVLSGKTADNVVFYPAITRYEDNSDGFVKYAPTNQVLAEIKADKLGTYLDSEDLNDLTYPGFYIGRNGNICINKPSGFNQFGLIVVRSATSGSYYKQILIRPNVAGETWSRTCSNGTWSAWTQEIYTDENVKQSPLVSTNSDYPLLMAYSANGTEETKAVWKDTNITYNPSTKTFKLVSGSTIDGSFFKGYSGAFTELIATFIGFWNGSTPLSFFSPNPNQITTPSEIVLPITSGTMALEEWQTRIGSMNLLPQKTTHKSGRVSSGATFTVNLDGTITVNRTTTSGTATFDLTSSSINGGMWLPNGTYYVKGCPEGGTTSTSSGYQLGVRCQKNNATYQLVNEAGDGATFTVDGDDFSSDGAWVRVVIILRSNVPAVNMLWKPMITLTSLSNRNTYYPPSMSNRQLTFEKMDSVNVATIENTDNASKAYTVNDYMVLRGQLYRVTQAISNGGAITIGTNVTATTVGAELKAIRNALNLN